MSAETIIFRDESGAELNYTAALDAIEARSSPNDPIVLQANRPSENVKDWERDAAAAAGGIFPPFPGSEMVEFILYRSGEELGRAEGMRREQVRLLRGLLERFNLLVPPCPSCETNDDVEIQTPEEGRPYSCNHCGLEFFGPDATALPSADTHV